MLIFRTLGTPTEESWPGVTALPHFFQGFPQFKAARKERLLGGDGAIPDLTKGARRLLEALLEPCPERRPTAREALAVWHERDFFLSLNFSKKA